MELKRIMKDDDLRDFAEMLKSLQMKIDFRVSSRGWAYLLETERLINKDEFDKVTNVINNCRRKGILPIDFVAEESSRAFQGVEIPSDESVVVDFGGWLRACKNAAEHYNLDWWDGEEYYIQMVVEKVDLVTLFNPVCREFHIPIANSKGWSSMLQRAEYARRFREAEDRGMKCVLLYCGDHDPDGLRISEFIRSNLAQLSEVSWGDGNRGYDPNGLIIERFGLNRDFIERHNFTWIDNLITGSKKNLADPNHKNFKMPYVQQYLADVGERKCEANVLVTMPDVARKLVRDAIVSYVGEDAEDRFEEKRQVVRDELDEFFERTKIKEPMDEALKIIEEEYS